MRRKDRTAAVDDDLFARRDMWNAVPGGRTRWGRRRDLPTEDAASLAHHPDDSAVRARWADQLGPYVEQQGPMDVLRLRERSEAPWPQAENPMVGYLIERASEMIVELGPEAALEWLATNAWFEGVIAERARIAHLIDDE